MAIKIKEADPEELIKLLQGLGLKGDVEEMLLSDIKKGFELNPDGSIDIIKYCAWLIIQNGKTRKNG